MDLGISGDFDVKPVATVAAHEFDQIAGIAEFTGIDHARGQVAAQCHQFADATVAPAIEQFGDAVAGRADARQMRRHRMPFCRDFIDHTQAALGVEQTHSSDGDGPLLTATLPSDWIPETRLRIEAFRKVALATDADEVAELRAKTDAPMMECKKALTEAEGNMDKAEDLLRVKLGSKAGKASSTTITRLSVEVVSTTTAPSAACTRPSRAMRPHPKSVPAMLALNFRPKRPNAKRMH